METAPRSRSRTPTSRGMSGSWQHLFFSLSGVTSITEQKCLCTLYQDSRDYCVSLYLKTELQKGCGSQGDSKPASPLLAVISKGKPEEYRTECRTLMGDREFVGVQPTWWGGSGTVLELDRGAFKGRGEGTPLRHLICPGWHCTALCLCRHRWLPLCQQRWKTQTWMTDCLAARGTYLSPAALRFLRGDFCDSEEGEEVEGSKQECQRTPK